jgi:hypothetical protein
MVGFCEYINEPSACLKTKSFWQDQQLKTVKD